MSLSQNSQPYSSNPCFPSMVLSNYGVGVLMRMYFLAKLYQHFYPCRLNDVIGCSYLFKRFLWISVIFSKFESFSGNLLIILSILIKKVLFLRIYGMPRIIVIGINPLERFFGICKFNNILCE